MDRVWDCCSIVLSLYKTGLDNTRLSYLLIHCSKDKTFNKSLKNVLYNWDSVNNSTKAWFDNKDNESDTVICCIVHRVEVL